MPRSLLPALLVAALAATSTSALAQSGVERTATTVKVADLNIQSEAGARVALLRIERAARAICGGEPDVRQLDRQAMFQTCVREAVDTTVAAAGSPALAALNGAPVRATTLAAVD